MIRSLKNNRGFSLMESLLSVVILSIIVMGGLGVTQGSLSRSVNREMSVVASQLANEKVESILADNQFVGYSYIVEDSQTYAAETLTGDFEGYIRIVTITEVSASDLTTPEEGSGIKKVDVVVRWGTEDNQKVMVSTLVADIGSAGEEAVVGVM
ncbi:MAG: prepilin-type N-terminal cleavage/methylation domain-containing protein [Deltaproteobacteria bacterium]|nr:prepilin-type N-terminal cleavage/methylation domain-containing protein [Deltaproteobacteria bacterium]